MSQFDNHTMTILKDYYAKGMQKYDVIAVALYGSQNYAMDTSNSDVDAYLITNIDFESKIAGLHDLEPKSIRCSHGIISVKPLDEYMALLLRHSPNAFEVLHTKYIIVNPKYKHIWDELANMKETLVNLDRYRLARVYVGMANSESQKALAFQTTPSKSQMKATSRAMHAIETAKRILDGMPFQKAIDASTMPEYDIMMMLKNGIWDNLMKESLNAMDDRIHELWHPYQTDRPKAVALPATTIKKLASLIRTAVSLS